MACGKKTEKKKKKQVKVLVIGTKKRDMSYKCQTAKSEQGCSNKGSPLFHSSYRGAHIDGAPTRRGRALLHLFEWETKEMLSVVLARVNLHEAITACNL